MDYYGWLGKLNTKTLYHRGSGTKTADKIKKCAFELGAERYKGDIRSKNLIEKEEKIYYILSIGFKKTAWAPYPFLFGNEINMILTRDTNAEETKGELWFIGSDIVKSLKGKLKLNSRDDAGDYYSLPITTVKELQIKSETYKDHEELKGILSRILGEV